MQLSQPRQLPALEFSDFKEGEGEAGRKPSAKPRSVYLTCWKRNTSLILNVERKNRSLEAHKHTRKRGRVTQRNPGEINREFNLGSSHPRSRLEITPTAP